MGCRRAAVCLAAAPTNGVASDRVYICTQLPAMPVSSYLAFPSLPLAWRFISVALSLGSPPADVIRYPALRSPDFPHDTTFRHDIARLRRPVAGVLYTFFSQKSTGTVDFSCDKVQGKRRDYACAERDDGRRPVYRGKTVQDKIARFGILHMREDQYRGYRDAGYGR